MNRRQGDERLISCAKCCYPLSIVFLLPDTTDTRHDLAHIYNGNTSNIANSIESNIIINNNINNNNNMNNNISNKTTIATIIWATRGLLSNRRCLLTLFWVQFNAMLLFYLKSNIEHIYSFPEQNSKRNKKLFSIYCFVNFSSSSPLFIWHSLFQLFLLFIVYACSFSNYFFPVKYGYC